MQVKKEETQESKKMVIVFPGTESLATLSAGELTNLRIRVESYDNYLRYLLRTKINQ